MAQGTTWRIIRRARLAVTAALAGLVLLPSAALATVDQLVPQALELEKQGKPGDAFVLLSPQSATRAGDPDFTATGLTSITLPVFAFLGPASLNGAATRMHDGFYQLQGRISGATGISRQDRIYAIGPLFLIDRRDTQADASLGLRYVLVSGISLRPRVDGLIGWTRWSGGTTTTGTTIASNGGGSMIWRAQVSNLPISGKATYDLAGYTQPVSAGGTLTPGMVSSARLAVDFSTSKVGFEASLTTGGSAYTMQSTGGVAAPSLALTATGTFTSLGNMAVSGNGCSGSGCGGRASGFPSGSGGAVAGLAYTFSSAQSGGVDVNGAIAFRKQ